MTHRVLDLVIPHVMQQREKFRDTVAIAHVEQGTIRVTAMPMARALGCFRRSLVDGGAFATEIERLDPVRELAVVMVIDGAPSMKVVRFGVDVPSAGGDA